MDAGEVTGTTQAHAGTGLLQGGAPEQPWAPRGTGGSSEPLSTPHRAVGAGLVKPTFDPSWDTKDRPHGVQGGAHVKVVTMNAHEIHLKPYFPKPILRTPEMGIYQFR